MENQKEALMSPCISDSSFDLELDSAFLPSCFSVLKTVDCRPKSEVKYENMASFVRRDKLRLLQLIIITQRRSVAKTPPKSVGCFQRRLFVCGCVCLSTR